MPARPRGNGTSGSKRTAADESNARLSSLEEQTAALLREARASVGRTRTRQGKSRKRRRAASSQTKQKDASAVVDAANAAEATGVTKALHDETGTLQNDSTSLVFAITDQSEVLPLDETALDVPISEEEAKSEGDVDPDAAALQPLPVSVPNDLQQQASEIASEGDGLEPKLKHSTPSNEIDDLSHSHLDEEDAEDTRGENTEGKGEVKLSEIIAAETQHIKTDFLQLDEAFWPEGTYYNAAADDSPQKSPVAKKSASTPKRKRLRRKRRSKMQAPESSNTLETENSPMEATTTIRPADTPDHEVTPLSFDRLEGDATKQENGDDNEEAEEQEIARSGRKDLDDAQTVLEDQASPMKETSTATRRPSMVMAKAQEQSLRDLGFLEETQRVALKIDDFVPGTNVSVADYDAQRQLVENVEAAEAKQKEDEADALARKLEHHRLALENQAATLAQSCVRGRLGRKRARNVREHGGLRHEKKALSQGSQSMSQETYADEHQVVKPVPVESEELDEDWTRVHDPSTGDTWYFNETTGESQWELPDSLGKARRTNDQLDVQIGKNHAESSIHFSSIMEEPIARIMSPKAREKKPLFGNAENSLQFGSSVAVDASGSPNTQITSNVKEAAQQYGTATDAELSGSLLHQEQDDLEYLTQPVMPQSQANDESYAGSSSHASNGEIASRSENANGKAEEDEDEDEEDDRDDETKGNAASAGFSFSVGSPVEVTTGSENPEYQGGKGGDLGDDVDARLSTAYSSALDSRPSDAISEAGSEFSQSTGLWSQSGETPRFFLPDGSTDVKLRETVRHALKQTKFDSVSTLLSSMAKEAKSLRKRSGKKHKRGDLDMKAVVQCANLSRQEPKMVAGLKIRTKGARGKRVRKQGRDRRGLGKDQRDEDTTLDPDEDTPAIYNVTYPGMRRQDLQGVDEVDEHEEVSPKDESAQRNNEPGGQHKEICFLCWSAGDDMVKRCDEHQRSKEAPAGKGSVLTCANWNLAALQRKYRAEEIQELFAKANACLRWDLNRKRFITVIQAKHPVYRATFDLLAGFNRRVRSLIKVRKWLKSVIDQLQLGKIKGDRAASKCSILRAKDTLMNNRWIRKFKETVILVEPQPPVTEGDIVLRGELDLEVGYKVMVRAVDGGPSHDFRFVMAPTAAPFALYRPRVFDDVPPPRFVRVPPPSYIFTPDADQELVRRFTTQASKKPILDENANQLRGTAVNVYMDMQLEGSWIERLASHAARTATEKAVKEIRDQIPQVVRMRTKHPPPTSVKYATFARRDFDVEGIKRLGGYPPMMAILSQEVTTAVCAQYGKFVVTSKTSIAPIKRTYDGFEDADGMIDTSLTFSSFNPPETASLGRSYAPLVSVLNTRLPPCIVASAAQHEKLSMEREAEKAAHAESLRRQLLDGDITKRVHDAQWQRYLEGDYARRLDDHKVRHVNGENREVQTGETVDVGFRTTAVAPSQPVETWVDTTEFVPSADIAVPNTPGIRGAITTQAGPDYPFCIPSTRELTLLDHFHLLAFAEASSNSTCCFTTLGRQDPGLYMLKANFRESLGVLEMRVYRSFAYFQMPHIEEFTTAEGVPYWYNRKTGETFWESPLIDLTSVPDNDTDRPLVEELYKASTTSERRKFSDTLGPKRKPPNQLQMRQHMLKDYESMAGENGGKENEEEEPEFARELARAAEKRRALDKRFRDRVGQTSVLKGTAPLLSVEEERAEAKRKRRELKKKKKKEKKKQKKAQAQQEDDDLEGNAADEVGQLRTRDRGSEPAQAPPEPAPGSPAHRRSTTRTLTSSRRASEMDQRGIAEASEDQDHATEHSALLSTIQTALQSVMASQQAESKDMSSDDFLKLGMGLGLGIGLGKKQHKLQQQQQHQQQQQEGKDARMEKTEESDAEEEEEDDDMGVYDVSSSARDKRGSHRDLKNKNAGRHGNGDEQPLVEGDRDVEHDDNDEEEGGHQADLLLVPTPRHEGPYSKPRIKPTPTPDEQEMLHTDVGGKDDDAAKDVGSDSDESDSDYSDSDEEEEELDKNFDTHEPAGEGRYWTATGTTVAKSRGQVMHSSTALPEGFVNSVYKPHTAKQHADYLPSLPNLNEAHSVGVVKPRNIIKDWNHTGFDPWSDGKDRYTTSFVPSLFVDEKGEDQSGGLFGDKAGLAERRAEVAEQQRLAEDLDKLFSWCRHGKYEDIDEYFNDPDCTFPIDAKDSLGNTLLSIAAQNGNKRIAKMCLRRGADINTQNLNGQTVLHYCMAYGFEPLAEYFMGKGADDSLVNADGLTCYEGLSLEDVQNL